MSSMRTNLTAGTRVTLALDGETFEAVVESTAVRYSRHLGADVTFVTFHEAGDVTAGLTFTLDEFTDAIHAAD